MCASSMLKTFLVREKKVVQSVTETLLRWNLQSFVEHHNDCIALICANNPHALYIHDGLWTMLWCVAMAPDALETFKIMTTDCLYM